MTSHEHEIQPDVSEDTRVCPNSCYSFTNPRTHEQEAVYRGRCRKNRCMPCVRWKVDHVGRALGIVRPATLLTISHLALSTDELASAWRKLRRFLREVTGLTYGDLRVVEPHADSELVHIHAIVTPRLSGAHALTASIAAGLGDDVDVRDINFIPGLARYVLKRATNPDTRLSHLRLNGSRLFQPSRGFWTPDGQHSPVRGGYVVLGSPGWTASSAAIGGQR